MNRNGKQEVGQHRDLIVVAHEGSLAVLGNGLGADRERSIGGLDVLNRVQHKPRGEFERKPVGNFGSDGAIHAESGIKGEGGSTATDGCAAGAS